MAETQGSVNHSWEPNLTRLLEQPDENQKRKAVNTKQLHVWEDHYKWEEFPFLHCTKGKLHCIVQKANFMDRQERKMGKRPEKKYQ